MADDRLSEAALDAEATRDVAVDWVRHEEPPKNPSAVYSVRIPADRIEQLRRVAAERGVQPTALIRTWVLAQLDAAEAGGERTRDWEREMRAAVDRLRELLSDGPLATVP
jgi:aryl-alcohol dehydrogenase-like predicted oxidoreductase